MTEVIHNDFSTDNMLVKASEYLLWDDPTNDTITIHYRSGPVQLAIPVSRTEFINMKSLDERLDFIASKIREALAANGNAMGTVDDKPTP